MKKPKQILNFKQLFDVVFDVTSSLPFLLFFIVPYLYDETNGYSLIVCLPISTLFIIFSSKFFLLI